MNKKYFPYKVSFLSKRDKIKYDKAYKKAVSAIRKAELVEDFKSKVTQTGLDLAKFIETGAYKKRSKPLTDEEFKRKMAEMTDSFASLARAFEIICTQPSFPTSKVIH